MNHLPVEPLPGAPRWFVDAVHAPYETIPLAHDGARLELLRWGGPGKPGLLLLHGNRAHARWFSPIAALLAGRFTVAALSWSGMGGSDWRARYGIAGYVEEAMAAIDAAGLHQAGPPVIAAHSFGGSSGIIAAAEHGSELAGVIVCDTYVGPDAASMGKPMATYPKVYATLDDALARYRLVPAQPCDNAWYVDWIARHSLRAVGADEPGGPGYVWRFDPTMWERLDWRDRWEAVARPQCPLAFIDGALSRIAGTRDQVRARVPAGTPFEQIAGAHHHLMLDQPLAFAEAVGRQAAAMFARAGVPSAPA